MHFRQSRMHPSMCVVGDEGTQSQRPTSTCISSSHIQNIQKGHIMRLKEPTHWKSWEDLVHP
eukprot:3890418-Prorocentrum_lima.AAC.1